MSNSVNMGSKFGQVKVIVVQGRRLVIRDFKSSDPYVILKLGNQVTKRLNSSRKDSIFRLNRYKIIYICCIRLQKQRS